MQVQVSQLRPHPRNREIYGDLDIESQEIKDLAALMGKKGMIQAITITKDFMIISGERRWLAAQILGWDMIEAGFSARTDEDEILMDLIISNAYRHKTNEAKIREGNIISEVESHLAKARTGQKDQGLGPVREIVGAQIGMSGSTYEKGKEIVDEIDRLQAEEPDAAEELRDLLNKKSIHAASEKLHKKDEPKDDGSIDYWPLLRHAHDILLSSYKKLATMRTDDTPVGLRSIVGNLKDMADRLSTWNPDKIAPCPTCAGTTKVLNDEKESVPCPYCINGKSGKFSGTNA